MKATFHLNQKASVFGGLLAGALSAAAFGFALTMHETFLLGLFYLAAIPLFVAVFTGGLPSVLLAAATGLGGSMFFLPVQPVLMYLLLIVFPSVLIGLLALRARMGDDQKLYFYPEGYLLIAASLYVSALFLGTALSMGDFGQGILDLSRQGIEQFLNKASAELPPEMVASIPDLIESWARIAPSLLSVSLVFYLLLSAVVGQVLVKQQNWNIRPNFGWDGLFLPQWVLPVVALTGIATFLLPDPYSYLTGNLCFILSVPFFFVGLAVVHTYAASRFLKGRLLFLILFYTILSILGWLAVLVALLGAVDQTLHLRQKFSNLPKPNSNS